jgi:nitric oxide reductase NorD protein
VSITALSESAKAPMARASVSADGKTISLPALQRRYPTAEQNERLYLVMAAHEAGHLEFGTYRLTMDLLADLVLTVCQRYGGALTPKPDSLAALFDLYPCPRLIRDLWTVLEDARVEYMLQTEYPGLRRDLVQLAAETITPRDPSRGVTVRELIVDGLLRLSTGESFSTAVPHAIEHEVARLWHLCQPVLTTTATAEGAIRIAHDVYVRMEELVPHRPKTIEAEHKTAEELSDAGAGTTAPELGADDYRPVTNWIYRGEMNPEYITGDIDRPVEPQPDVEGLASPGSRSRARSDGEAGGRRSERQSGAGDVLGGGRSLPSVVEEMLSIDVDSQPIPDAAGRETHAVRYPEWDCTLQDYRVHWCRVVERPADSGSDECVSTALTVHRSTIRSLRRFFESLRPPAFRRVPGQADGEDLDVDAVVRRAAEQRAGFEGGDRIYIRREKRERDVAVAFLVDVSGSTGRHVESGRRVIDVERESLVLLCEALDAAGDQYALYAYSGQGRAAVDVLTIKTFDEPLGITTAQRLGGLAPRQQNRDGAAIRHMVAKLKARPSKTRILILLSDGRPLDGEYKDEYSLEDTKAALREARHEGIHPFCVTVDRQADHYLRRMYGDVQYAVIDRVESLPARLPRIYQRLAT